MRVRDRFAGAKLNTCYNCLDRHVEDGAGEQTALVYHCAYTGQVTTWTYNRLTQRVHEYVYHTPTASVLFADSLHYATYTHNCKVLLHLVMPFTINELCATTRSRTLIC